MADPGKQRAAIYDRASKDRHRKGKSVGEQHVENEAACADHGWVLTGSYADNHKSASRFASTERPGWDRFMADLEAHQFDVVVFWESSRGDRKASQWIAFLDSCRSLGVLIHVTTHTRTYDMRIARDWRALAEDGVDNAYESEKISDRTKRGLRANAAQGRPHGKPQYGFSRLYNPRTGRLEGQHVDDQERAAFAPACVVEKAWVGLTAYSRAGVVREASTRFAAGEALHGISVDLNRRGIPAPEGGKWMAPQLRVLLQRPAFIGMRMHHGEGIPSPDWYPPILSEELFYACQARLTDPERAGKRDYTVRHLLSGLAVCGVCGNPVRAISRQGGGSSRYTCRARQPDGSAGYHVVRNQARVERYVERVAILWMSQPAALETMSVREDPGGELQGVMDQIAATQAHLEEFYDKAADGMSATGMARIEGKILKKLADLEGQARRLRGRFVSGSARLGSREDAERQWAEWTIPQRRALLDDLFEKIEILKVGAGRHFYTDEESVRLTWRTEQS